MLLSIVFISVCATLGGLLAVSTGSLSGLGSFWSVAAGACVGVIVGGSFGAAVVALGRIAARRATAACPGARAVNALLVGGAGTAAAAVVAVALGLLIPACAARSALQGALLLAGGYIGARAGLAFEEPLWRSGDDTTAGTRRRRAGGRTKVLDTSVIIDGRVGDLLGTGFIEGEILLPEFVLDELQAIADSSDALRRRKGRRGLEILRHLMEDDRVDIRVTTHDYPSIREVDRKLIRLAHEEDAALLTTDYNLNRVAQVEGIHILNVNELANAIKPRFLPGEQLDVEVIDRGAEINQGVGYLDDGTMIVVENGRRHIGRTIKATVKSTLQTDAGRMLFAEPVHEASRWEK
ncbi:MAG: PIN domain-containing protein [Candidatus Bipolaricaulota bacterium]